MRIFIVDNGSEVNLSIFQRVRVFISCPCKTSLMAIFNRHYVGKCSEKLLLVISLMHKENETANKNLNTRSVSKVPRIIEEKEGVTVENIKEQEREDIDCTQKNIQTLHQKKEKEEELSMKKAEERKKDQGMYLLDHNILDAIKNNK